MPVIGNCAECARLWDAYSQAIHYHVDLEYELRAAAIHYDRAAVEALFQLVAEAAQEREDLRHEIAQHDHQEHRNGMLWKQIRAV